VKHRRIFRHFTFLIRFLRSVFPNTTSPPGCTLRLCAVELDFLKALRSTDWIVAERLIQEAEPLERWGAPEEGGSAGLAVRSASERDRLTGHVAFMRLQLFLAKGDSVALRDQLELMPDPIPPTPKTEGAADVAVARSPVYCVSKLLFEVEWYCLIKNYHGAVTPLMSCLRICADFHLRKLELTARLHVAHLQLHLKLSSDAVRVLRQVLPPLLAQGDAFECGRGHLLHAKCLVASTSSTGGNDAPVGSERRMAMLQAIGSLNRAGDCFHLVGDKQREGDVLYLKARLYNDLDMPNERNLVAKTYKEHVLTYPTNVSSKLHIML
jgi:hypothetical protein